MAEALGFPLTSLDGKTAAHCYDDLCRAVTRMLAEPAKYAAMDPKNGWGDSVSAREYLQTFARLCGMHPNTTVRILR